MTDLTKITTPFGLLDKETQNALKAHGGPYEVYTSENCVGIWCRTDVPYWYLGQTYRVKKALPKEIWVNEYPLMNPLPGYRSENEAKAVASHTALRVAVKYREVQDE